MITRKMATVALALGLGAGVLGAQGCYAEAGYGGTSAGVGVGYASSSDVVGSYGYEPQYYDGYMVYYDDVGRPFYYANGVRVFVSTGSPYYAGYVAHWRAQRPAYTRWYAHQGYRYRGYRLQGGYYGGHNGYRYGQRSGAHGHPGHRGGHEQREQQRHQQHERRERH